MRARNECLKVLKGLGIKVYDATNTPIGVFTTHSGQEIVIHRSHSYYWIAQGNIPLQSAQLLYKFDGDTIRAGGDCACRPPETWARLIDGATGLPVIPASEVASLSPLVKAAVMDGVMDGDYLIEGSRGVEAVSVVQEYHIDTDEALVRFVRLLTVPNLAVTLGLV